MDNGHGLTSKQGVVKASGIITRGIVSDGKAFSFLATVYVAVIVTIVAAWFVSGIFQATFMIGWLIGLPLGSVLISSLIVVDQNSVAIVAFFGKFYAAKQAGLRLKFPYPLASVAGRVSLRTHELVVRAKIKTIDDVFVDLPVHVQLRANDPERAFFKFDDPDAQIGSFVLNALRARTAALDMQHLFSDRDSIAKDILKGWTPAPKKAPSPAGGGPASKAEGDAPPSETVPAPAPVAGIADRLEADYGFTIDALLLEEPIVPTDIVTASNTAKAAQRGLEVAQLQGEAHKTRVVKQAEADADAKALSGKGTADQMKAIAEGRVKIIKDLKEETGERAEAVLAFLGITQQLDTMRALGDSKASLILLPGGLDGSARSISDGVTAFVTALRAQSLKTDAPAGEESRVATDPGVVEGREALAEKRS
ncbi:MAG: hypothetical protein IBJ15_00250 [Alphaproteobacteria bacterium]|nr:hypothetical protein [Alphaproteobacteria bacterium]